MLYRFAGGGQIPSLPGTQTPPMQSGPQQPQRYIPGPQDFGWLSPGSGEAVDSVGNQNATPGQFGTGLATALGMAIGPALGMAMSPIGVASLMNQVVDPFGLTQNKAETIDNFANYVSGMSAAEGMSGMGGMSTTGPEAQAGGYGFAGGEDGTGVGYADGGGVRGALGGRTRSGLIAGSTPGRADAVPSGLEEGAHVIPADVVSAAGDGNTSAGALAIGRRFGVLPGPAMMNGGEVPALTSDGEFYFAPEDVKAAGGHGALQRFTDKTRASYAKKLKNLTSRK